MDAEQVVTEEHGNLLLRRIALEPCECGDPDCPSNQAPSFLHLVSAKDRPEYWVNALSLDYPDEERLDAMIGNDESREYLIRMAALYGQSFELFEADPIGFAVYCEECCQGLNMPMIEEMLDRPVEFTLEMRRRGEEAIFRDMAPRQEIELVLH